MASDAQNRGGWPNDLPQHARERLADMRAHKLFTSDLSVNEFLLVKEAGFDPLGLVMGTSIYQISPNLPQLPPGSPGCELSHMTQALYHARDLAMNRMEAEADALGADGIVGVRLTVNLSTNPQRADIEQFRQWQRWSKKAGFPSQASAMLPQMAPLMTPQMAQLSSLFNAQATPMTYSAYTPNWPQIAWNQWDTWCRQRGWFERPPPPWARPRSGVMYALGNNIAEFMAIGTAVRHRDGESFKNRKGKPFQSDLSGQDFWTLVRTGFRPVGFVMGNCVYYIPPHLLRASAYQNAELTMYTHALYDARELAIERLQDEAEALGATGIVGVTIAEKQHSWRSNPLNAGNAALQFGEVIELFVVGTAVVPMPGGGMLPRPTLVLTANDKGSSFKAYSSAHTFDSNFEDAEGEERE